MVDPRFVSTSFFLSFGFSLSLLDDEKGDFFGSLWIFSPRLLRDVFSVSVSPLLDSSATSPWRFLPLFDSVALLGDTALSLSVGLVDEGKRRSVYWWLSETQINAGECCSGESKVFQSLEDGGGKRVLLRYNSVGINSITKRKDEEEVKEEKKEEEEEKGKEKEEEEEEDAAGDGHLWWPGSADLDIHEMSGRKMVTIA
ncbi:hypothetical protein F2Q69_00058251 [Brassica cretica]|uniref:Uncharacterized protein n=1 Tax=Brassica cretica TaxID=69181 RepID=A0A8S9RDF5_BRACR|nr:hypothetical protein F2Q69_00058251 [Brassica cretica]